MMTLLWFRRDLRLADNPALAAAVARGKPIVPVYVHDEAEAGPWAPGGASRWWLHGSLESLSQSLAAKGNTLTLRRGRTEEVLDALIAETGADAVYWNRRYEPWATARDAKLKTKLAERGIEVRSFNASLLKEPWELTTQKGDPYRVFTPFWKALRAGGDPPQPLPAPRRMPAPAAIPDGGDLAQWGLLPTKPDWAGGLRKAWRPGEEGAQRRFDNFTTEAMLAYRDRRNLPGVTGTSRLSPHLHFGEIGPRQLWHAATARALAQTGAAMPQDVETYLSELAWREFSYHLLFHFPSLPESPLRAEFADFPWADNPGGLSAWKRGLTGYPIVDAGMRELWVTGWMHNRVRMIAASFLIKDLLTIGIAVRNGSGTRWSTPTSPTMRQAGSGSQGAARMQRPISASSIRRYRARSSIPTGLMCAAGSRNSQSSPLRSSMRPGRQSRSNSRMPAFGWGATTRRRSSITRWRASAH
jgi:deoxyribodipyrimidine photo-lyase